MTQESGIQVLKKKYKRFKKRGTLYSGVCSAEGCEEIFFRTDHNARYCSRYCGSRKTVKNPGTKNAAGYVRVRAPGHPNADTRGQILEHRLVMSRALGRPLVAGENVHHISGERDRNEISNLELWITSQPSGTRVRDLISYVAKHHKEAVLREIGKQNAS